MVRDEKKYQMATDFRKRGFSYSEIAKICGVSKSTVSTWLSKKSFSKRVKQENIERAARENKKRIGLLNKARGTERAVRYKEALRNADTEFKHYSSDSLFIAGLMLYKSSGDTRDRGRIRLSAGDADVHRIFMKFAREYLGIEKEQIKFWLLLYPDLSETRCVTVWSKKLRISKSQWYKNQVIGGESTKGALHIGVGNTIIGNTVLKQKLMRWIELASKQL